MTEKQEEPKEKKMPKIQTKLEAHETPRERNDSVKNKESKRQKEPKMETTEHKVDAYDRYLLVRKKERPRARDLIPKIFDKFEK